MSSTWAEPLSSSSETPSAPKNLCCLTSSCFWTKSLRNLFFLPESKRNNVFVIEFSKKVSDLNYGQGEKLLWLNHLLPLQTAVKRLLRSLGQQQAGCEQHFPGSGTLLRASELSSLLYLEHWQRVTVDPELIPPLLNLHPLRRCKGILQESVTEFKGTFSQI